MPQPPNSGSIEITQGLGAESPKASAGNLITTADKNKAKALDARVEADRADGSTTTHETDGASAEHPSGNDALPVSSAAVAGAPFVEHLRELRRRIIWILIALAIGAVAVFAVADVVFRWLVLPYESALGDVAQMQMIYTAPQEYFITQLKLSCFVGLYIAFPVVAYQFQAFVAPGLYSNEKKLFYPYMIGAPLLFIGGGAFVYLVVMPLAMQFFLSMQSSGEFLEISMLVKVSEYLSLVTRLMIAFGIVFQMPVVIALLSMLGLVSAKSLRAKRRYAVVGVFFIAAFLTPPDPISQIGLAIPALLLYEAGVFIAARIERSKAA